MSGTRTRVCAWCGSEFTAPRRPGPALQYCKPAHRQRAYEHRRALEASGSRIATAEEVRALQARVRRLEHDNRKLREELTETSAEYARLYRQLHPLQPGQIDLAAIPHASSRTTDEPAAPAESAATRRRGLRRQR